MTVTPSKLSRLAAFNILIACVVMGLKYVAYLWTGSVALYSDALESIVNVVTAVVALIALRIASRPADRGHPYGHHKAEYFSAGLSGALILTAALMILQAAYEGWSAPRKLEAPLEGLIINGVATLLNAGWGWVLISNGRAWRSPALVADGWHLMTDVATSVGVLAGLVLALATGWLILDPLLAALVALNILWAGWQIMGQSFGGLMDQSVAADILARIRDVISSSASGALQVHDLRTRVAGPVTFVEFHLVVPGSMPVSEAHEICDRIEAALKEAIDGVDVLIHAEPEGEAKSRGALTF